MLGRPVLATRGGELISGDVYTRVEGSRTLRHRVTAGQAQFGILKFVANRDSQEGNPCYVSFKGESLQNREVKLDQFFVEGSVHWRVGIEF